MADKWIAECLPCKWQEAHDDEDAAITSAVSHVMANHANVTSAIRAQSVMGHVQQRTITDNPPTNAPDSPAAPPQTGQPLGESEAKEQE